MRMRFRRTVASMTILAGLLGSPARASHDHPKKASRLVVDFVRATVQCLAPYTHTHDAPGRAAEELRPEIERLRASPNGRVRDQAGWLLTRLADRSRS